MPVTLSDETVDLLLYELPNLRREVEAMMPKVNGTGVVPPVGAIPGSPVEAIAIARAEISAVLDAVDRGWKALPPDLRQVAKARYRKKFMIHELQNKFRCSRATVMRRLSLIRSVIAGHLALQPETSVRTVINKIEGEIFTNVRHKG